MEIKTKKDFHWLLIPALITIYKWLFKKNDYSSVVEKEEGTQKVLNAINWVLIYGLVAFVIIREITYQVPVIIMT